MKKTLIVYWFCTAVVGLVMLGSGIADLGSAEMGKIYQRLHIPDVAVTCLSMMKITGSVVLLFPFRERVKRWSYVFFALLLVSGTLDFLLSEEAVVSYMVPTTLFVLLAISYQTLGEPDAER